MKEVYGQKKREEVQNNSGTVGSAEADTCELEYGTKDAHCIKQN